MKENISSTINKLFNSDNWNKARQILIKELKKKNNKNNHWLLTRLATTYYEEKKYSRAAKISEKALRIAPDCPLVNWDYAGTLDMLGEKKKAIKVWMRLIKKDVNKLAFEECGEGLANAKGLIMDCYYRIGLAYKDLGKRKLALKYLLEHLKLRVPGNRSIYSLNEVRKKIKDLKM